MNTYQNYLKYLQEWFYNQCNGNWEKQYGISINTMDNPGWSIIIDLVNTQLEDKKFQDNIVERSEMEWFQCFKRGKKYEAFGGPYQLDTLLQIFFEWTELFPMNNPLSKRDLLEIDFLRHLQDFYVQQCDGDWEHDYGFEIKTIANPGWSVIINITDTTLEYKDFSEIDIKRSDTDWFQCKVENSKFIGIGGTLNLTEIMEKFIYWMVTL